MSRGVPVFVTSLIVVILIAAVFFILINTNKLSFSPSLKSSEIQSERGEITRNVAELERDIASLNKEIIRLSNMGGGAENLEEISKLAQERTDNLEVMLEEDPALAFSLLLPYEYFKSMPDELKDSFEQKTVAEGVIQSIYYDGSEDRIDYHLITGEGRKRLFFVNEYPPIISGASVRINGYELGNLIIALFSEQNLELIETTNYAANNLDEGMNSPAFSPPLTNARDYLDFVRNESLGEQKTVVILYRFQDSPPDYPFTKEEIYQNIFEGQVQEFFNESSFGKTFFTGEVFGWYTLDWACDGMAGGIPNEVGIALIDEEVYFPEYSRIIFIGDDRSCDSLVGSGTIGKWSLDSNDGSFRASVANVEFTKHFFTKAPMPSGGERDYEWKAGLGLLSHELGHNFIASHANSLECGSEIQQGVCLSGSYGNLFDVMGKAWVIGIPLRFGDFFENNTNAGFHFGGVFKEQFGWIEENSTLKINMDGKYRLRPIEGKNAIIAKIDQEDYPQIGSYYLEYRSPHGYDSSISDPLSEGNLGGIFINRISWEQFFPPNQPNIFAPATFLLDTSPSTYDPYDSDWYDVVLKQGDIYIDEGDGIEITNLGEDLSNPRDPKIFFEVNVSEPKCVREKPKISFFPGEEFKVYVYPGQQGFLRMMIGFWNTDSIICPSSVFDLDVEVPEGWIFDVGNYTPFPVELESRRSKFLPNFFWDNADFEVPSNVEFGNYTIVMTFKNLDTGLNEEKDLNVEVLGACEEVQNVDDLDRIRENLVGCHIQTANIDLSGINWEPIGRNLDEFKGIYDGNGFTIYNLKSVSDRKGTRGLFGVNMGTIRNVKLENVEIRGTQQNGAIAGSNKGLIETSGVISGRIESRLGYAGGITGNNDGGTIRNSFSQAEIAGDNNVGGLAGRSYGEIVNSYSMGFVEGNSDTGGLIGLNSGGYIISSYWDIETSGQQNSAGGEGRTTIEMTSVPRPGNTYVDWDFQEVWDQVNGDYPFLKWQR